jgi:hypothetical protein
MIVSNANHHQPRFHVIAGRSGTFYGMPMLAGHVYPIAAPGQPGFGGDGRPTARAQLDRPGFIAFWPGH